MLRKFYNFYIDVELAEGLKAIKARDGISESVRHASRRPSRTDHARVWWGREREGAALLRIRLAYANAWPKRFIEGGEELGECRTPRTGERNHPFPWR